MQFEYQIVDKLLNIYHSEKQNTDIIHMFHKEYYTKFDHCMSSKSTNSVNFINKNMYIFSL
jgi:hypothetical protein